MTIQSKLTLAMTVHTCVQIYILRCHNLHKVNSTKLNPIRRVEFLNLKIFLQDTIVITIVRNYIIAYLHYYPQCVD